MQIICKGQSFFFFFFFCLDQNLALMGNVHLVMGKCSLERQGVKVRFKPMDVAYHFTFVKKMSRLQPCRHRHEKNSKEMYRYTIIFIPGSRVMCDSSYYYFILLSK